MPPRHFWWLYELLGDGPKAKQGLSADDKKAVLEMLHGNYNGGFW